MPTQPQERILFRGFRTCICVATSLPLVERAMIDAGVIKHNIDIFQMGYNGFRVDASSGTHAGGGNTDVAQYGDLAIEIWRDWGWAMQRRYTWQGFTPHAHGWPYGCSHLSPAGVDQLVQWAHRQNGLRSRGRVEGRWPIKTWRQAILDHRGVPITPVNEGTELKPPAKFHRTKDWRIRKGAWVTAPINDQGDVSMLTGPGTIFAVANLSVTGLPAGQGLQARFVTQDVKGSSTKTITPYPIVEIVGTAGQTFGQLSIYDSIGAAPKGSTRRVRLQLLTPVDVTLTDLFIRARKD